MKKAKRLLSVVLTVLMLCSLMITVPIIAGAIPSEEAFVNTIANLQRTFVDGKYWNKYCATDYSHTGDTPCTGYGLTSKVKCTTRGYCGDSNGKGCSCTCGAYVENGVEKAWQCMGFAYKMAFLCFGVSPYSDSWIQTNSLGTVYAGDIIRINGNMHTIFVYKVSGSTIYYADCNRTGPCRVSWGNTISYSDLNSRTTYKKHLNGNTLTGNGAPTPVSHNPEGYLDGVESPAPGKIRVTGWALDLDSPTTSIDVHIYVGGEAGTSNAEGHVIKANAVRTDVANVYSGNGVGNYHGFDATFSTSKTGSQPVYAYGINIGGGSNRPLTNSPRSVTISKDNEKPTITNAQISKLSSQGYRVSCKINDNIGVTTVKFPTWTRKKNEKGNEQDDLIWHIGTITGKTATFYVNKKDHNNEMGPYVTDIYAYDAAGNQTLLSAGEITLTDDSPVLIRSSEHNNHIYSLYNSDMNWNEAKAWCERQGGHLATISDNNEWNAIKELLAAMNGVPCWLGANSTSGTWKWVTGESVTIKDLWDTGQPDRLNNEELYLGTYNNGQYLDCYKWNDFKLSPATIGGFVCEFDDIKTAIKPVATESLNGHTYELYDNWLTWQQAYRICDKLGGHLATVSSKEENDFILKLANKADSQKGVWLGGSDYHRENNWFWITGEKFDYAPWNTKQPDNWDNNEHFLQMYNNGKWNDLPNDNTGSPMMFVCEYENNMDFSKYTPSFITLYNGHEYWYFNSSVDWQTANKICAAKGGHLVTIESAAENASIHANLSMLDKDETWLGYTDIEKEGVFKDTKGNDVKYTNWSSGEYNNADGIEDYAEMYKDGTWNDLRGFAFQYRSIGFVCEFDRINMFNSDGSRCIDPVKTFKADNHTYELYDVSLTWNDAKDACEKMGGHLVTITSENEQDIIEFMLTNGSKNQYWLGLTDCKTGTEWITGESVIFTNWGNGDPNASKRADGKSENYAQILNKDNPKSSAEKRFKWNDSFYDNTFPGEEDYFSLGNVGFICEYDEYSKPQPSTEPTEPKTTEPSKTNISKWIVSGIKNMTYTGKLLRQNGATVSKNGKYADFSVKYRNNLNVGTATVIITGTGDYTGTIVKTFKITKAANPITVKTSTKVVKLSAVKKKAQTVKPITVSKPQGKVSYKLTSVPNTLKRLVKINSKGVITLGKWAKAKKGNYSIMISITAKGNNNYNTKTITRTVTLRIK